MNYKETLEFAKQNNINITNLTIAHELSACNCKKITNDKDFEMVCDHIRELWLDTDVSVTIESITHAITQELEHGDLTLEMIADGEDRTEDYDIIEIVCQCY